MMDYISIPTFVMIILVLAIVILLIISVILALKHLNYVKDIQQYAPESEVFMKCRKENTQCICLHDAGSHYTRFIQATKTKNTSWEFDVGHYGPKFSGDFASYYEPDLYHGNLEVLHFGTMSPYSLGLKSVMSICNMMDLLRKDEFEKLRFLRYQSLHFLMSCKANELRDNCELYLKSYAQKRVGQIIPETTDEFMTLIERAIDVYTHMPLEGDKPDEQVCYYDTLETVMEEVPVEEVKKVGFFKKIKILTTKEQPVKTSEPMFKLVNRRIYKMVGLSYNFAIQSIGYAITSSDVGIMEKLAIEKGNLDGRDNVDDFWKKKIFPALLIIGAIVIGIIAITQLGGA